MPAPPSDPTRIALEASWLQLTRTTLPAIAADRGWPVSRDHCFQRILLDNACGGRWYDHVADRPAYRHASDAILATAIALGSAAEAGSVDLVDSIDEASPGGDSLRCVFSTSRPADKIARKEKNNGERWA